VGETAAEIAAEIDAGIDDDKHSIWVAAPTDAATQMQAGLLPTMHSTLETLDLLRQLPAAPGLHFPFDQYQRHRDVQIVIAQLAAALRQPQLQILDVGGVHLTRHFLPEHAIVVANLRQDEATQVQGSGAALPFADQSFDVVMAVDTLEHIPPEKRTAFVRELTRVAAKYVLVTGPFASPLNVEAEQILDTYILRTSGLRHYYLAEHLTFGLPDVHQLTSQLAEAGYTVTASPSGHTGRWLTMMLLRFALATTPAGQEASEWLEQLYNHQFYWADHTEPSYRQIVVAERQPALQAGADARAATFFAAARQIYGEPNLELLLGLWQTVAGAQGLKDPTEEIAALRAQNDHLASQVAALQSGRFMRTMAYLHKLRQKLLPPP
jgi:hypothetical protein